MQKEENQNLKMLLASEEEIFSQVVADDHAFRRLDKVVNWKKLANPLRKEYKSDGRKGYDVEKGVKMLVIQHWEDYSDRQMEKAVRENLAIKWFCGFGLTEQTPDHSYFGELRKRIGPEKLAKVFRKMNKMLEKQGLFGNVFAVIDASSIISKTALWEERDRAISDGNKKLDNAVVSKYAADKDAKWGAKGKNKVWFGYKRNTSIDMKHGLIRKVTVTPANTPDFKAVKNLAERGKVYFMDKGYDYTEVEIELKRIGSHASTIEKNNKKTKNKDLDNWKSKVRMPYEGVFSKTSKRAKYRGQLKVFMQCILESMAHNLKKAVKYTPDLAFTV